MLAAFGFEAYLNWLGAELFPDWEDIERKLSPKDKVKRISDELGVKFDRRRRPWQTLTLLSNFRNTIAHGKRDPMKPLTKKTVSRHDLTGLPAEFLKADWQIFCDLESAEQVNEDVCKIIELLHAQAGLDGSPFGFGSQTHSVLLLPEGHCHMRVRLEQPEFLKQERDRHEADGWIFYKMDYSPNEGFGVIFTRPKNTRKLVTKRNS